MAKINFLTAYPTATPAADSIVIGSLAANGATNNFLMSAIATYVMGANTLTLQDVCDNGTATTTGMTIADTLTLSKATGTGLSVTSNATIGGDIDANGRLSVAELVHAELAVGTGLQVTADASVGGSLTATSLQAGGVTMITGSSTSFGSGITSLFGMNSFSDFKLIGNEPSSATDTGSAGQIAVDADYIYVCTATDTWKRVAIATW